MSASRLVPQVLIILLFYYTDFNLNTSSLSPNCVVLFAFIFLFPAKIFLLNLKILLDKHVGELSDLPFDGHVDETRTVLTVLHDETTQQRLINFRL